MRHAISFLLAAAVWLLALSQPALGFDEQVTHPALTEESTRRSSLDATLKTEIGLNAGIVTFLRGQGSDRLRVFEWLRQGSLLEDDPPCRASHHFHNPLKPFTTSGVTNQAFVVRLGCSGSGFLPPRSSVTWGTGLISPTARGPATGNPFDWDAARVAFLNGLTAETPEAREAELARTFETLGHLLHLVQDLAVPAHARNDFPAHEAFFPQATLNITRWFQEPFERFVRRNESLIAEAAARAEKVDFVGQLVTRFWDTDRYTGANPTADLLQGLAEYTNANFASPNTIFTEDLDPSNEFAFPYPRRRSTNFDLVTSKDDRLARFVTAEDGREDRVLYLAKTGDGELIDRFLKLSFFTGDVLDKAPPGTPAKLLLQIDDEVHRAYAAKLLPRTIGYGAALIDYFFRGKLEVDLVEAAPNDEFIVRLKGDNASRDKLDGGTLRLYADVPDTNNPAGLRTPVAALDPTLTVTAEAGAAVESARFRIPEDASRFVAVYTGKLGLEEEAFPGGVIGRVFETARVEEVFSDGTRWHLRTPNGVFPLPIFGPAADRIPDSDKIENLRWGDLDNTLVGRTRLGPGAPNTFKAYTLKRPVGSTLVPLKADPDAPPAPPGEPAAMVVELEDTLRTATFPMGLDVKTTVDFEGSHRLTQDLLTFDGRQRIFFDRFTGEYVTFPIIGDNLFNDPNFDESARRASEFFEAGDIRVERRVNVTFTVPAIFNVTLEAGRYNTATRPYDWVVREIGLDARGRMLALVEVRLTQPENNIREVVTEKRNRLSGAIEPLETVRLVVQFPVRTLLFAVVEVGATDPAKSLLASSGTPLFKAVTNHVTPITTLQKHITGEAEDGRMVELWELAGALQPAAFNEPGPLVVTGAVSTLSGPQAFSLEGWYREEIRAAVETPVSVQTGTVTPTFVYAKVRAGRDDPPVYKAYREVATGTFLQGYVTSLRDGQRMRPTSRAEHLLVFGRLVGVSEGEEGVLLSWKAEDQEAALALDTEIDPAERHRLAGVTSRRAMVVSDFTSHLIDLDTRTEFTAFGEDLRDRFVWLDPTFFYNFQDLKFYRPQPFRKTALPAKLKALDPNPVGDYHAIRRP